MIFGRVTRWTMRPMIVVNGIQPSTVTSVLLGELRFFASRMIQIARKSQIAIRIK